jgi:hypothetical protein
MHLTRTAMLLCCEIRFINPADGITTVSDNDVNCPPDRGGVKREVTAKASGIS